MRVSERRAHENGRDYALRVIRDNIISLDLAPGSKVSDHELAAELGLSRTPVREALIELSKASIVKMYPQKGSIIAPIDYDLMQEAFFMREVLECAVVQECCHIEDMSVLDPLDENLALQRFNLVNRSPEELMVLDNEFHSTLFAAVNMTHVHALMNSITIHFDRVRSMSYKSVKEIKTVQAHQEILDAIRVRDEKNAVEKMRKHLRNYTVEKEELMRNYPDYFVK